MSEHRFQLPGFKRSHPAWSLASLAVHAAVFALLLGTAGTTVIVTRTSEPQYIHIGTREHALPGRTQSAPTIEEQPTVPDAPLVASDSGAATGRPSYYAPRVVPVGLPPRTITRLDPVLGTAERIGAAGYGSGRLWVGPIEAQLGVMGPSEDQSTHAARVDSAVRAKLLAFLDTIPADSFATPQVRPWVTEINGQKWGVDGSWVYLGGLKLPTALLALLPLPQGNYQAAREAAELQRIREQIMQAAWQAETNADFRRYVREIRERKDREREERRRLMGTDSIP